jgi:TPR repeat protein
MRKPLALLLAALPAAASTHAADIGGWMEQKQRAERAKDECPALIALAARTEKTAEGAAGLYYGAGLCYLHSEQVARDTVAAQAWFARADELEHPLARRALLALREAAANNEQHPRGWHCHELGFGRRICHGGPSPMY